MTILECEQIVASLIAENNPDNGKLIEYYKGVIDKAYIGAVKKALSIQ